MPDNAECSADCGEEEARVSVEILQPSELPETLPQIGLRSPNEGEVIAEGDVLLDIQLENWVLGPHPGNHVHLIVDNEPYIALRDVGAPLNLSALYRRTFERELEPGLHVVRMFPSRGHHESVKSGRPFVIRSFYVGASDGESFDPEAPVLTYSRPKGSAPHGQDLLLDFYISGVAGLVDDAASEPGDTVRVAEGGTASTETEWADHAIPGEAGYTVRLTLDGVAHTLRQWAPYAVRGLEVGQHEIRLQLIAPNGEQAPGPFNNTVRTIRIEATQP